MTGDARTTHLGDRNPGRVALLVSDRAAELPPRFRGAEQPADGKTICRSCQAVARLGTAEVCCWWPFGCATRADEPYPRLCWDCCGDHERVDLIDIAGCVVAAVRLREHR